MNNEQNEKQIYLMQSVALTNYAKMCIKLKEVPKIEIVEMLNNCEDVKKLIASNEICLTVIK